MKSKKWIIALLVGVLVLGGTVFAIRLENGDSGDTTSDGLKRVPSLSLPRAKGEALNLRSFKDQVVIVHFWASWCPPCIPEIPEILGAAKRLPKDQAGRPIQWVLVSQDQNWEKAHSIVQEEMLPENVTLVLDSEAKFSDLFGSYQFPETYVVNRDGGIIAKWIGAQAWSGSWGDQAVAGIEKLSREKVITTPTPVAPGK